MHVSSLHAIRAWDSQHRRSSPMIADHRQDGIQ